MKRIFNFGKIPYRHEDKPYTVKIEVEMERECSIPFYFDINITGDIYDSEGNFCYGGGILDEINEYRNWLNDPEKFDFIYDLYKKMYRHAGTPEQEKLIAEWIDAGNEYDDEKVYEMLMDKNMYIANFTGWTYEGCRGNYYENEPYRYGSSWVIHKLPQDVVKEVKKLLCED